MVDGGPSRLTGLRLLLSSPNGEKGGSEEGQKKFEEESIRPFSPTGTRTPLSPPLLKRTSPDDSASSSSAGGVWEVGLRKKKKKEGKKNQKTFCLSLCPIFDTAAEPFRSSSSTRATQCCRSPLPLHDTQYLYSAVVVVFFFLGQPCIPRRHLVYWR